MSAYDGMSAEERKRLGIQLGISTPDDLSPVWRQSLDKEEALLAARALRTVLDVGAYGWSIGEVAIGQALLERLTAASR